MNRILPTYVGFLPVRNITFVQNSVFEVKGRNTVSVVSKPSMLQAGRSSIFLPLWILSACENNTCNLKVFWSGRAIQFRKNTLFRRNVEKHTSDSTIECVRNRNVLHTFFPYDNRVTFWYEYCLILRVFKFEKHHLCAK
jgi:hypothetical protein